MYTRASVLQEHEECRLPTIWPATKPVASFRLETLLKKLVSVQGNSGPMVLHNVVGRYTAYVWGLVKDGVLSHRGNGWGLAVSRAQCLCGVLRANL